MAINFYAPLEMIRLVLPNMRSRKKGHIINISSVSGMMAMPTMGLYSSSKFALEALSEALWYEVKPWNIKVTLVEPGFIRSEAFTKVPLSRKAKVVKNNEDCPYNNHYSSMAPFVAKMMRLTFAKPQSVAKKVSRTMKRRHPPLRQPATFDAYLFHILKKVLPSSIYLRLLYWTLPGSEKWGNEMVVESDFANFILKKNEEAETAVKNLDFVDAKKPSDKKKTAHGYKSKIVN
jgi:short-subunit dehydrogenase